MFGHAKPEQLNDVGKVILLGGMELGVGDGRRRLLPQDLNNLAVDPGKGPPARPAEELQDSNQPLMAHQGVAEC